MTIKNNKLVMVLEDDTDLAEGIELSLQSDELNFVICETIAEARKALEHYSFDLLIFDINLPDGNGLEFCRELKKKMQIPIALLTAKSMEMDIVKGLENGADDYITKPFAIEELLARIRRALKKSSMADGVGTDGRSADDVKEAAVLANGGGRVKLDKKQHIVTVDCNNVELTQREFAMLQTLLENMDIVLSRETLLDKVCGYDYVGETNIVDVYVRYLRSKIDDAFGIKLIQTVRGVCYDIRSH